MRRFIGCCDVCGSSIYDDDINCNVLSTFTTEELVNELKKRTGASYTWVHPCMDTVVTVGSPAILPKEASNGFRCKQD